MSQDEALRLSAEVIDKSTGPLKNIAAMLRSVAREGQEHTEALGKGFGRLEGGMKAAAGTASSVFMPAMASIGVTSLSVSAAIAGVGAAVRSFGSSAKEIGQLSRDTGIAADKLREVQGILGKVGVDAGQSGSALQQFAESARQAKDGVGPIIEFLHRNGRTGEGHEYFMGLADRIKNAKNVTEQLDLALEGIFHVEGAAGQRKYAQEVLGMADAARLASGQLGSLKDQREAFRKNNGVLSPQDIKDAEDYARAMDGLKGTVSKLGDAIAREATPHLTEAAKAVKGFLDDERQGVTPAIVSMVREILLATRGVNWKQAIGEAGAGFKQLKTDVTAAIGEVRAVLREFGDKDTSGPIVELFRQVGQAAKDTGTAVRATALTLTAFKDIVSGDFAKGWERLQEVDRLTDAGVGQRKNAGPSKPPTALDEQLDAQMRGQTVDPRPRFSADEAKRIADLEAVLSSKQAELAYQDRRFPIRNDAMVKRLTEEVLRLTEELKRLREGAAGAGGATVQQQSFDGTGTGLGGLIHRASLGGLGAAAQVGRALGGGSGIVVPERGGSGGGYAPDSGVGRSGRALRGHRGGSAPHGSSGPVDIGGGMRGRRFGAPHPDSGAGRAGAKLRGEGAGGGTNQGANPGDYKEILDYIAKSEGTAGRNGDGYNTSLGYGRYLPGGKEQKLTEMTLDQVSALGHHMRHQPGNPNSSALGRYQIVGDTMRRLMRQMGLNGTELFDEKMQDRMAAELARQRGANPHALGQEWASLKGAKSEHAAELMRRVRPGASTTPGDRRKPDFASFLRERSKTTRIGRGENETQPVDPSTGTSLDYLNRSLEASRKQDAANFSKGGESENEFGVALQEKGRGLRGSPYAPARDLSLAEIREKYAAPKANGAGFAGAYKARQAEEDAQREDMQLRPAARSALQGALRGGTAGATESADRALLDVHIRNPGPQTSVGVKTSGSIFREIKQTKGRQMQGAGEDI